ncbi:MAG: adenylate/guanylate cyclase domain-containing protein [Proteobacteria bacterium]|nr:adenylate/guanylate cyclase domain-containing protein [Pseudomonadota bacterium]MBI3498592.1 adenylate/guanylate cyclase domain-containing protein [Pseudomonadota bacterium]
MSVPLGAEVSSAGFDSYRETCGSADLALALTQAALKSQQTEAFVSAAGRTLSDSPLRAARLFVSMRALHPAFRARTYLWEQDTGYVRTVEWPHGLENRPGYYDSPDHLVHRTGSELRVRRPGMSGEHTCDLYGTLRAQGYTDYLIVPLLLGDGTINTLSIATREPAGFRDHDLDWLRESAPLFTVILERHTALEALDAVLEAYLGRGVGEQILRGKIHAGDGELIDAAILIADLHDFTQHAAHLDPAATVALLNRYFDCLVSPIREHAGHVLKFMGDAVLAFFPALAAEAAPDPLAAVGAIRRRLAALNTVRSSAGQRLLRHALCVHYGQVLYGNIGSTERLDFTIIGEAVNLTARGVEAAKELGVEYLFTGAYVERFGAVGLTFSGHRILRGIPQPVEMFTPAGDWAC